MENSALWTIQTQEKVLLHIWEGLGWREQNWVVQKVWIRLTFQGGCGSCTVLVSSFDYSTKKILHNSVNACLAPLVSVHGKHVITIEGLGNVANPHPVQEAVAKSNGRWVLCWSQSMWILYTRNRHVALCSIKEQSEIYSSWNGRSFWRWFYDLMQGNLCRCTGYRPILDGAKSLLGKPCSSGCSTNGICTSVSCGKVSNFYNG